MWVLLFLRHANAAKIPHVRGALHLIYYYTAPFQKYLSAHLVVSYLISPSISLPPLIPRRRVFNVTLYIPSTIFITPAFIELPSDIELTRQRLFKLPDAELKFTTIKYNRL